MTSGLIVFTNFTKFSASTNKSLTPYQLHPSDFARMSHRRAGAGLATQPARKKEITCIMDPICFLYASVALSSHFFVSRFFAASLSLVLLIVCKAEPRTSASKVLSLPTWSFENYRELMCKTILLLFQILLSLDECIKQLDLLLMQCLWAQDSSRTQWLPCSSYQPTLSCDVQHSFPHTLLKEDILYFY